jgi:hypothetical protein
VALDPAAMTQRFAAGFAERARGAVPRVRACDVEEVYYRPGRHCGILYRLRFDGREAPGHEEWLYARMLPREVLRPRFDRALDAVIAAGASALVRSTLDPVSLWEELGMIVWTFPIDPKLPGLRDVADPARVARRFAHEQARLRFGAPRGAGSGEAGLGAGPRRRDTVAFERVKYMPTKRCVLRYHVGTDSGNGPSADPFVFYAKAYPSGESEAQFRLQRAALESLAAARATVEIPEPIVHLGDESAIWFAEWGGRGLVELAVGFGWEDMAERAAEALAAFHRTAIAGIPDAETPAAMLEEFRSNGDKYTARVRAHGPLMAGMLARLEHGLPASVGRRPRVATHGAFRAEHVRIRGEHTALIDLDGMALGDPLRDVAEFVASLEFMALASPEAPIDTELVSRRFLECYDAAVPWRVDGASVAWYALGSLVGKLHAAVKRLSSPTLDRLETGGEALVERWSGLEDWAPRAPLAPRERTRSVAARPRLDEVAS